MNDWNERSYQYAVVDIGANSVRMNSYDIDTADGSFSVSASARSMLGLAAYVKDGALTPDGCGKLFAVLREFLARANSVPCDGFAAFATASLRGLSNSGKICLSIKEKLGIDIEIISGETEAGYDLAAIRYRFPEAKTGVLIDMGGGSTEIVAFDGETVRTAVSLPIGCVMLMKRFTDCTKRNPFPKKENIARIRDYVKTTLASCPELQNLGGNAFLIGGTARAAAKLHSALTDEKPITDGYTFSLSELQKTADAAFRDARKGGKLLRSTVPDRITTVLPGLCAYLVIAEHMGLSAFTLSGAGVREGYLLEFIRKTFLRKSQEF